MYTHGLKGVAVLAIAVAGWLSLAEESSAQFRYRASIGSPGFGISFGNAPYSYGYSPYYGSRFGSSPYSYGYSPYYGSPYYGFRNPYSAFYSTPYVGYADYYRPYNTRYRYYYDYPRSWTTYGPSYYSPGYYSAYGYGSSPSYYYDTSPRSYYYSSYPSGTSSNGGAQESDNAVHVLVRVPDQNAEVWFNDKKTQQTGTEREFVSPELATGHNYTYRVRARWNENGREVDRTRTVTVRPGQWLTVDFTTQQGTDVSTPPDQRDKRDGTPTPENRKDDRRPDGQ